MKKRRFTEEQIIHALKRANSGEAVTEICRQLGISRQTFYQWRNKYQGMGMLLRQLRQLEEENQMLKRLVADLSLDKHLPQAELSKAVMPADGDSEIDIRTPANEASRV